jgi:hypothetical protein
MCSLHPQLAALCVNSRVSSGMKYLHMSTIPTPTHIYRTDGLLTAVGYFFSAALVDNIYW